MASLSKAAQIDLEQISSHVQQELHEIPKGQEDGTLFNHFQAYFKKYTLDVKAIARMESSQEQEGMNYTPSNKMDYLLYIFPKFKIPMMAVKSVYKDSVRIAWTHHLIHHMIVYAGLCLDDEKTLSMDSNWLDINSQYFVDHVNKDYNGNAGIGPELESFSTILPEKDISITMPFGFSNSIVQALPLHDVKNKVQFKLGFRLEISKLLRMQELNHDTGEWRNISVITSYLEGVNEATKVPLPKIMARYALQNKQIKDHFKKEEKVRELFLLDLCSISSSNDIDFGKQIDIPLECAFPCRGIFYTAQNVTAVENNYYANYTTNANDHTMGSDPVKKISIYYAGIERESGLDEIDIKMLTYNELPDDPIDVGYHAFSNAFNMKTVDHDTGIIYLTNNARLRLHIRDRKPGEPKTKFNIQIKLLIDKKLMHDCKNGKLLVEEWHTSTVA
uniref:Major capsid protein n=1 Tax=Pithovirus LCPAC404 TaxID=2506597 RepID=A0A481ZH31_9VIRU|nr:MAG: major capsid protein [Pithovirus LCPAC404]